MEPAFELSFWCGTCPFLFRRLETANQTLSLESVQERLTGALSDPDDEGVREAFGALLPENQYVPMLLRVEPRLVVPGKDGDYFSGEQVATWGLDQLWGLSAYPQTPYYRTFETAVDASAHLYDFVVPMVPPTWTTRERVEEYIELLSLGTAPTAVAVSTLDVCEPASGLPARNSAGRERDKPSRPYGPLPPPRTCRHLGSTMGVVAVRPGRAQADAAGLKGR